MGNIAKDMDKKMRVKRARSKLSASLTKLDNDREYYLTKAKQAKARGETSSYQLARSGLASTLGQQKKTREMLLNIDITMQMRDTTVMTHDFLENISKIFKDISKVNRHLNLKKTQEQLKAAMMGMEGMQINLDTLLTDAESSFVDMAHSGGVVNDKELDRLIMGEVNVEEKMVESALDGMLIGESIDNENL